MGSIFGKAKRGFGMLKKVKKKDSNKTLAGMMNEIYGSSSILSKSYKPKYIGKKLKKKKGKEGDILKKHPSLAKQKYSDSAVNKYLTKEFKKKK